jgi:RNA polymerase sigma-B factor
MQELYLRLTQVVSSLGQQLGRSPTIAELATQTQVSEEEVLEALEAGQAYRFASLDVPKGGSEDGDTIGEGLGEDDPDLANAESRVVLSPLMAKLAPRQRQIIRLRFFEGLTQSEIASRLGISQMHVSRLLARSVAELRAAGLEADERA